MIKHRGVIAVLLLLVVGVAGTYATIEVYTAYSLPDPATADMPGLFKWLVLRNLEDEPEETQATLINRFEQLIHEPVDLDDSEELSEDYLNQLMKNAEFLRKKWFLDKVVLYEKLETSECHPFLEKQFAIIDRWYELEDQFTTHFQAKANQPSLPSLYAMIPTWTQESDEKLSQQIDTAVRDGLVCWLCTTDMAKQSAATRIDLVHSLEANMSDEVNLGEVTADLTAQQQKTYWYNVDVLAAEAFYEKADQYLKLPKEKRGPFLDQVIQRVTKMTVVDQLMEHSDSGTAAGGDSSDKMSVIADQWVARAEVKHQPQLNQFLNALKAAMLKRKIFGGLMKLFPRRQD